MIVIKKTISEEITAEIELNDETEFYTRCPECGQLVEASEEIINDFAGYLFDDVGIICKNCAMKSAVKSAFTEKA